MISLILPYWMRQDAADKALALLDKHYTYWGELEVLVIDDGSPVPFVAPPTRLDLRVIRLPTKKWPKSPVSCWNEGVRKARGDIVVISCIEILHEAPVLERMMAELWEQGPNGYILASAWCPESQEWHCHSEHGSAGAAPIPTGTGRAFCAMLYKELYLRAGGWDEDYREGAGYEDVDWIYRLQRAGAEFVIRDDLRVLHPKAGASIAWGAEKFERNKALLADKWPKGPAPVTFVCLNAGNYCGRGAEYVNKLYDMVCRNMPSGRTFRFVCLTDNPDGLHEHIEPLSLPGDLERWYGKLYLFKRGLFRDGERMVFLDLDTIIIGKLDDLIDYSGDFATLTDFLFPEQVGPAVMAWRAGGPASKIWNEWVAHGKPRNPMGDLWWINQLDGGAFVTKADRLQELFRGQFVSYKAHCRPLPPRGAKVICFHGQPRPHDATDEWVAMAWQIGGSIPADLETVSNTGFEQVAENVRAACRLDYPWLPQLPAHDGEIAIVGGAPSIMEYLDELRARAAAGMKVCAVNGTHDFLIDHGIVPDFHLMIDARPDNARFITTPAKEYWLASQCSREVFAAIKSPATIVHMNTARILESIPASMKPTNLISTGSTVGLAGMGIAYCFGWRRISVYGMDSSYEETRHAYPQPLNDGDAVIEAVAGGRTFKAAPWMVAQVQHFQKLATELAQADCEISVRCDGLLGHVAWLMTQEQNGIPAQHAA